MALKITGTNTAAAPGITGDDTDTGLFYASDVLGFSTGGTETVSYTHLTLPTTPYV